MNADYLFQRFRFERYAEVDSEILGRIADACIVDGHIDVNALRDGLALCRGQMSAVIVAKTDPGTVIIVKGNKPLELVYHSKLRALFYASSAKYFQAALSDTKGCECVPTDPMRIYAFHCDDLPDVQRVLFKFVKQVRPKAPDGGMLI